MANVTLQMLRSIGGYGSVGDIITLAQTAQTDAMVANGQAVTYAGPAVPTPVPTNISRFNYYLAVPTALAGVVGVDYFVFLTAAGAIPTLPTAVGNVSRYTIVNMSGAAITPAVTAAQTIDGAVPASLANGAKINLTSDNANWRSGV